MMTHEATYIDQATKWSIITISGFLILATLLTFFRNIPFQYLLLAITFLAAVPFFFSVEKIICLLTFYIIAFGNFIFKGNLFPISVNYLFIDAGMILLFLLLISELSLKQNKTDTRSYFGWYFSLFFLVVALAFLVGYQNSNGLQRISSEFRILSYYAVYFIARRYFKEVKWIKIFSLTVILAALIASFDYIYTYYSMQYVRFVSRQVHVFLLVIPFLISLMILDKNKIRKLACFVTLIPIGLAVIISQTRGTWVSIIIAILLAALLSLFANIKIQRRGLSFALTGFALGAILWLSLSFIGGISKKNVESVETRVESLTSLQGDHSLLMRANSYWTVVQKIKQRPWLGHGLGDRATYRFFGQYATQTNVDSTYLTILWKMGIIGLIPFLVLYLLLLKRAFLIYRREQDVLLKIFSIGILSAFTAFLILGTISPILITSRFNFLFAVLFAITEIVSRRKFQQQNEK